MCFEKCAIKFIFTNVNFLTGRYAPPPRAIFFNLREISIFEKSDLFLWPTVSFVIGLFFSMMQLIGSIRSEDGFSNTSGCEASATFKSCLNEAFENCIRGQKTNCPQDVVSMRNFDLADKFGRSSLASNTRARSGHYFWQVCF